MNPSRLAVEGSDLTSKVKDKGVKPSFALGPKIELIAEGKVPLPEVWITTFFLPLLGVFDTIKRTPSFLRVTGTKA